MLARSIPVATNENTSYQQFPAAHAGSELYIRDLAFELMRRGHHPVAYSTHLGAVAEELRAATVPVIDRLESLGEPPDIIHGQHHYETLSALLRFPDTPALYYCHGWLPWQEATLKHPNILYYAAVDELCRERLIAEGGIDARRIEVILNFFDESLFPRRTPLPPKPKLALLLSNDFSEGASLNILREACARYDIELHVRGLGNGNPTARPGTLLAAYDIVFAKARSGSPTLLRQPSFCALREGWGRWSLAETSPRCANGTSVFGRSTGRSTSIWSLWS
jgi:hypothetical protein